MSETERKPRTIGIAVEALNELEVRWHLVMNDATYDVTLQSSEIDVEGLGPLKLDAARLLGQPSVLCDVAEHFEAEIRAGRALPPRTTLPATTAPPFNLRRAFKVLALGRSYRAHAVELGNAPLDRPIVFSKFTECMVGSGATVAIPPDADGKMDHEAELAIVIGEDAANLAEGEGAGRIAGYVIANDLTLRTVQTAAKKAGHPWLRAKNFPGALPIGPWFTPAWAVPQPERLVITCKVNGEVRQQAPVSQMTWSVGRAVEELSRLWPLRAGDVISTGTPAGVSGLNPGDVCAIEIASADVSLGTLVTHIAAS